MGHNDKMMNLTYMVEFGALEAIKSSRIYTGENEPGIRFSSSVEGMEGRRGDRNGVSVENHEMSRPRTCSFIGNIDAFSSVWKDLDLIPPKERGSNQMTSLFAFQLFHSVSFSSIDKHKWVLPKVRFFDSDLGVGGGEALRSIYFSPIKKIPVSSVGPTPPSLSL